MSFCSSLCYHTTCHTCVSTNYNSFNNFICTLIYLSYIHKINPLPYILLQQYRLRLYHRIVLDLMDLRRLHRRLLFHLHQDRQHILRRRLILQQHEKYGYDLKHRHHLHTILEHL